MTIYKVLEPDGRAPLGVGSWPLPTTDTPGAWLEIKGDLEPCHNGLHLVEGEMDLLGFLEYGPDLYEAEYDGERLDHGDKFVVRKARLLRKIGTWNERTQRLFACDCAERALPRFEKKHPDDNRPRKAIEVARQYALGNATKVEWDAAKDAAWAAWAAWAAAWTAWAAKDAEWTAWYAAWAAAQVADWDTERKWQAARLLQYIGGALS